MMIRLGLAFLVIALSGCEGDFAGKRPQNSSILNGPFAMEIFDLDGVDHLAVISANNLNRTDAGNIQFYSLVNSRVPVKSTALNPLRIPSNVSDLEFVTIDGQERLYITQRTTDPAGRSKGVLLAYYREGADFVPLQKNGADFSVSLGRNPLQILTVPYDGRDLLAISMEREASILFYDLVNDQFVDPRSEASAPDAVINEEQEIFGAGFYMQPRQSIVAGQDDRVGVSLNGRAGFGIGPLVYLGGAMELLVAANVLENALHSYRLSDWTNHQNFTWDLRAFRGDTRISDTVLRRGTRENGFRGIDADDNGKVYVSSRSDNSVYELAQTAFEIEKDGFRNTVGYPQNDRSRRIAVDFDTDVTDDNFPRLGDLVVDKTGGAATRLWVLGVGRPTKGEAGRLYRVDLGTSEVTSSDLGIGPLRLLWFKDAGDVESVYVANNRNDSVFVIDPDTLAVLVELKNN
jgi:hypothetical protein